MQASEQIFQLLDTKRRNIGQVKIDGKMEQVLTGEFTPGPSFSLVAEIFQKFEAAVNVQALGIVDQLDKQIATLGLQLYLPEHGQSIKIHDVQIWSDGGFSCHLASDLVRSVNGLSHSDKDSNLVTIAH